MKHKYNNIEYEISDKYSFKDFTGRDLSNEKDMNDLVIYGSCLSHETPDASVLPSDLLGTTFIKCNLSNVKIPDGNMVIDCITTRFKVQNDLRDWEIDSENKPVKVIGEKFWIQQGFSVDPLDIPKTKANSITDIKKAGG